jgi:hypothetical protein
MLFAVLLAGGVLVLHAFFLEPVRNVITAANWVRTECLIRESDIDPAANRPRIRYSYRYDNALYHSQRVWFVRSGGYTAAETRQILQRYPKGAQTHCFVNPKDPSFAVLERGLKPELLIGLVPLAAAIVGLVGLLGTLRRLALGHRPDRNRITTFTPAKRNRRRGPVRLRARRGVTQMLAVLTLAILWNAVIFFLVLEVISTWQEGVPGCYGWLLTLVALPFVLIGLGGIAAVIYLFLKLFNPRPVLTLSNANIEPGGTVNLAWAFTGRSRLLRRLRILLEGREEATYARGTGFATDCEIFAALPIVQTDRPAEIARGRARLTMPADALPTFESPHNRIVWSIRVLGEITGWPNVDEQFELNVLPPAPREFRIPNQ